MIIIKNKSSIQKMKTAGNCLASIMSEVADYIKPGISTLDLDQFIEEKMHSKGLKPECKGYAGYRHATCISLNDVIVHGVPSKSVILKEGDFVKVDVVGSYKGYCADMARSFFVGQANGTAQRMAQVAQEALDGAIASIKPGVHLSDISSGIQKVVESAGFNVVRDFVGHGIGKAMHEAPEVPNFGTPGKGPILREGMTLAIEPMITENSAAVSIMSDGWTAKTRDGGLAAHVEDTVVVSRDGAQVLTRLDSAISG